VASPAERGGGALIRFGLPGVLLLGTLLALVPVYLHLLAPRPPERRPLPTARFLTPDPRTRVQVVRRPQDPLLLALRVLLLLLLAAGLADPRWFPPREGTLRVVLLDAGVGMAGGWEEGVGEARRLLEEVGGEGRLVLFHREWARPAAGGGPAFWDSLAAAGPGAEESLYVAGLRAIRGVSEAEPRADSVAVWLVTRPRWEAWTHGLPGLREPMYAGGITLEAVGEGESPRSLPATRPSAAVTPEAEGAPPFLTASLEVLGREVLRGVEAPLPGPGLRVMAGVPEVEVLETLLAGVRRGDTLVMEVGSGGEGSGELPREGWVWSAPSSSRAPRHLLLPGGVVLPPPGARNPGMPGPGARILAAWEDGDPAAAAVPLGEGCLVSVAFPLVEGDLPADPGYPLLMVALAAGCAGPPGGVGSGPLDRSARSVLTGEARGLPPVVATPGGSGGAPLGGVFLLGAFLVALLEGWMVYRGRWMKGEG